VAIHFPLPSAAERAAIFGRYAKQLPQDSRDRLAQTSDGLSGRNILDVCKGARTRRDLKGLGGGGRRLYSPRHHC
jgi:AAA+ superfamily predicted ATPase